MPFCPSCRTEYEPDVEVCPDCGAPMVAKLASDTIDEEMRDVFICYDKPLADRLMSGLGRAGVDALLRDRSDHAFPTNIGTSAEQRIAVPEREQYKALALLREAREDGMIGPNDGTLLEPQSPP